MAIRLVRESSETPNVTNKDDARMVRYAYGGYDGIVKNYGSELDATIDGSKLKIGSGRVILQGWEVDLDSNGWEVSVSGISGTQYYSVYLEVNLIAETASIKSSYLTSEYPEIDPGDDLTMYPSGTSRMLLYNVKVVSGQIVEIKKRVEVLSYVRTLIEEMIKRVEEAGFKMASVEDGGITLKDGWTDAYTTPDTLMGSQALSPSGVVKKSGILCTLSGLSVYSHTKARLDSSNILTIPETTIASIPERFRPKSEHLDQSVPCVISVWVSRAIPSVGTYAMLSSSYGGYVTVKKDGSVSVSGTIQTDETILFDKNHPCQIRIPIQSWEVQL